MVKEYKKGKRTQITTLIIADFNIFFLKKYLGSIYRVHTIGDTSPNPMCQENFASVTTSDA